MVVVAPISTRSLGDQVADELRRLVITREIAPGTPIVEEDLAEMFGTSRGPIRDALRRLSSEGLVHLNGRHSVFRGLTEVDVDELFSLRQILETAALRRAMTLDLPDLLRRYDEALEEMTLAVRDADHSAFPTADARFHAAHFQTADHHRLVAIWDTYRASIELVLLASRETYQDLEPSLQSHVELRAVVASGDIEAAVQNLESHLENARRRALSTTAD